MPILKIRQLCKTFTLHERGRVIEAFQDISMDVHAGLMTCMVGASGSGKSSVIRCIYRSYIPDSGSILYQSADDQLYDLATVDAQTILYLRREEVRLVSQFLHALPRQTTHQVVAWPLREIGWKADDALEAATVIMNRIGLPERLWHIPPSTFSGGEKQLVNLARALVVKPRLLLLDEPTASLDPRSTQLIVDAIESMKSDNIAMLAIFHNREIVSRLADIRIDMQGGINLNNHENESTVTEEINS